MITIFSSHNVNHFFCQHKRGCFSIDPSKLIKNLVRKEEKGRERKRKEEKGKERKRKEKKGKEGERKKPLRNSQK